jgi:6-phosphogluconolactonase
MSTPHGAPELVVLPDPAAVAAEAARRIVAEIAATNGPFALALAGGSTPRAVYALLAGRHVAEVDWARVAIYFGDERCVPPEHAESNFRMATATLFVPLAQSGHSPRLIARMQGEIDPDEAAQEYAARLRHLPQRDGHPVFDLVLLGMGPDGHTASLFPGSSALLAEGNVAATDQAHLGVRRISLTYPVLNAAKHVLVLVTGAEKAPALRLALEGPPGAVPMRDVRPSEGAMTMLVDRAAAAQADSASA